MVLLTFIAVVVLGCGALFFGFLVIEFLWSVYDGYSIDWGPFGFCTVGFVGCAYGLWSLL